jgi:glycosyltransferase involved in cell wall biosynthesis
MRAEDGQGRSMEPAPGGPTLGIVDRVPCVSIVMPTYRRARYIGEAIRSLQIQTLGDFELIVQDDGDGRDGTREAVRKLAGDDQRIRYRRNPSRLGMPGNLNAGIADTRGEFVAVCHDHDLYRPRFLERMVDALQRHPRAQFVHCALDTISPAGDHLPGPAEDWPDVIDGQAWLRFMLSRLTCPVCALTVVRRETYARYGLYDASFGFISDVEMWMRLSRRGDVAYVRDPLILVREREPDHFATRQAVALLSVQWRIHRRYVDLAYKGPERVVRHALLAVRVQREMWRSRVSSVLRRLRRRGP